MEIEKEDLREGSREGESKRGRVGESFIAGGLAHTA